MKKIAFASRQAKTMPHYTDGCSSASHLCMVLKRA
jgi:hypothetical protein